jgi:membrane protein YqaA with SNARE-associated domain
MGNFWTANLVMFLCGIAGATIFIPNTELALLALANMDKAPAMHIFGATIDIARYSTHTTWLLPVAAALGSGVANTLWYLVGAGVLKVRWKVLDKIRKFDANRLGRGKEVLLVTAALFSLPPNTPLAFAAGAIHYGLPRYYLVTILPKITRYYLVMTVGRAVISGLIRLVT